jgi:glycosyltransferase involved in cell wall biosynthesis
MAGCEDFEGYAGFLRKLYGDRPLAARLGAAGKDFAEENFEIEKIGARLERFYSELCFETPGWRKLFWLA